MREVPGRSAPVRDGEYQPTYIDGGDGTIYDAVTGLMWTRTSDLDGDGEVTDYDDKRTQADAVALVATLNATNHLGHNDWRVPTIKELYSLMDFRGTDPVSSDTSTLVKFIDESYFTIGFGDESAGDRVIDSQFVTTSIYVSTVMGGQTAMFGLNLVDGRIKGYPTQGKSFYVLLCRGNTDYGINQFIDNSDDTLTDTASNLMWAQNDSGTGMDWEGALAWVQARNAENYLGYSDWCLPNIKELHSLLDYTRSPDTTASAAIDPLFNCTAITNLAGQADFPWYWSGTTHLNSAGNSSRASYVCFGRGLGSMDGSTVIDVHGAGCQRSDPKSGSELDYPAISSSPQGDVEIVFNHVRPVRDASLPTFSAVLAAVQTERQLSWESEAGRTYAIEFSGDLNSGFSDLATGLTGTPPHNSVNLPMTGDKTFFRVRRE